MRIDIDIAEIKAFIAAGINLDEGGDERACLNRITADIGDVYLRERSAGILSMYEVDDSFRERLRILANICNDNEHRCNECPIRKYCNSFISNARQNVDANAPKMVDLFCGAGGLSLGFCQEGFHTILANDIEECCIDTYAHNHPETPRDHIIQGDIRLVVDELEGLVEGQNIDIVVGGPPCQGFSMANRQRLIDDPRNYLYRNYVGVVRRLQPCFFVMENVKGMLSVSEQVKDDFRRIGYEVECHVLNAADFGIPQNRERLIYIGNRVGIDNGDVFRRIHEISVDIPQYRLEDALEGLRELQASRERNTTGEGTEESGYVIERKRENVTNEYIDYINQGRQYNICLNHKARYNNDRDIEIFGRLNPGDRSDDPKIADIMPYARRNGIFKDKYFKLQPDKVCKTITAHMKYDCNMYIHPNQARGLTPREAARVQSYPDDYFFRGAYTKTYMQIGNSVPPLLGRAIARAIVEFL